MQRISEAEGARCCSTRCEISQEGKKKKAEATAAAVASALEAKEEAKVDDSAKTDDARDQPTEEKKE